MGKKKMKNSKESIPESSAAKDKEKLVNTAVNETVAQIPAAIQQDDLSVVHDADVSQKTMAEVQTGMVEPVPVGSEDMAPGSHEDPDTIPVIQPKPLTKEDETKAELTDPTRTVSVSTASGSQEVSDIPSDSMIPPTTILTKDAEAKAELMDSEPIATAATVSGSQEDSEMSPPPPESVVPPTPLSKEEIGKYIYRSL